jgi:hypothetical protein
VTICAIGGSAAAGEFPPSADLAAHAGLPDPLVAFDGAPAATVDDWRSRRRPELVALFEHYMYGRQPAAPERVVGRVLFEDSNAFDGKGTLREVELTFGPPEWPKIYLLVAAPNPANDGDGAASGGVAEVRPACFVGCNFGGNHLRLEDQRIRLPTAWMQASMPGVVDNRATAAGRGHQAEGWDLWPLEAAIDRGYAIATFYCGDIQPDRPGVNEGMRATTPAESATDRASTEDDAATGTIMWWAWGIQRALDYLTTDSAIDAKRIAVVGHSRLGKTALLAGALDERIALTIANQAGCGGSGPSRHDDRRAETVAIITDKFPHWFCGNFAKFGADPARLPFDQNGLVALCAPRPVLFTAAADDQWANPSGQFDVLRSATPVYELLGVEGLADRAMPKPGDPLIDSRLGYWIRPGEHAMGAADWEAFFQFADEWLK